MSDGEWTVYARSETIRCPGTKQDRRAQPSRAVEGDRRRDPRPCPHRWGRVLSGITAVRVRRTGCAATPGASDVLECPACHCPIEFWKYGSGEQAA